AHRQGDCTSDARVSLQGAWVFNAIQGTTAANPKIAVERGPKARFHVVAQVSLEREGRDLLLGICPGRKLIPRKEVMIHGEEPACSVRVEYPMSPALRQTKLGLKGPAVCAVIDQLCGIVLSRRCHHLQADAKECLLLPSTELFQIHCGPTLQV